MNKKHYPTLAIALILSLILVPLAFADVLDADGDPLVPSTQPLDFGTVCLGSTSMRTALLAIRRTGGGNVFANGANVNVTPGAVTGTGLSASGGGVITLPNDWVSKPNNTVSTSVSSTVAFVAGTLGSFSGTVDYSAVSSSLTRNATLNVSANVISCNTPPTITVNDVTKEGNTTGGWTLVFSDIGSASDAEDGVPSVACVPPLGSVLPLGGNIVVCTATDSGGLTAMDSGTVTVVDMTAPSISCPANVSGTVGQSVSLGSPTVSDIVDASPAVGNNAPASFPPGMTNVTWTAMDASGNNDSCSQTVTMTYAFNGFFQPIDMQPMVNVAKAGSAIPVKFSLGGYFGLNIFAGTPGSIKIVCESNVAEGVIEETVTAGSSSLSYDASTDQYTYVWKTDRGWSSTCRQLRVTLNDGTTHVANFRFNK